VDTRYKDKDFLRRIKVRPILREERSRWQELMREHHYLGFAGAVGERIEYIATVDEQWVALILWSVSALKIAPRDRWIGWNWRVQLERLKLVANNSRFLVLPGARVPNLASRVLGLNLRRLSMDYEAFYGHPILLTETFVDGSRFRGSCYKAAGWLEIGATRGFTRVRRGYVENGIAKKILVKPLYDGAVADLANPLRDPLNRKGGTAIMLNYKKLPIEGKGSLLEVLRTIKDPRGAKGRQYPLCAILAIATCAMLSGAKGYQAIWDWAKNLSDKERRRLFCPNGKLPSESSFRKTLQRIDSNEFDMKIGEWLLKQSEFQAAAGGCVAVDGKTLKRSHDGEKRAMHLLSVFLHEAEVTVAQTEVSDKTNEIPMLKEILDPLDLAGKVVTVDALHTQNESARFIVMDKKADYNMIVKDNQPTLRKDLAPWLAEPAFSPSES
jgi:hypothetical protein